MKQPHERIRGLREDHDLKQREVATYLGVAPQTYCNYENGRRQIPIWVIIKLTELYRVSADYLLGTNHSYPATPNLKHQPLVNIPTHDMIYDIQP